MVFIERYPNQNASLLKHLIFQINVNETDQNESENQARQRDSISGLSQLKNCDNIRRRIVVGTAVLAAKGKPATVALPIGNWKTRDSLTQKNRNAAISIDLDIKIEMDNDHTDLTAVLKLMCRCKNLPSQPLVLQLPALHPWQLTRAILAASEVFVLTKVNMGNQLTPHLKRVRNHRKIILGLSIQQNIGPCHLSAVA